jgi:hypothetical protein
VRIGVTGPVLPRLVEGGRQRVAFLLYRVDVGGEQQIATVEPIHRLRHHRI